MSGKSISFTADPLTQTRLVWARHVAETLLGGAKPTAIIRRALAHYCSHLEQLIAVDRNNPERRSEGSLLEKAGYGSHNEIAAEIITVTPLRKLSAMLQEKQDAERPPADWLERELEQWRNEKAWDDAHPDEPYARSIHNN